MSWLITGAIVVGGGLLYQQQQDAKKLDRAQVKAIKGQQKADAVSRAEAETNAAVEANQRIVAQKRIAAGKPPEETLGDGSAIASSTEPYVKPESARRLRRAMGGMS